MVAGGEPRLGRSWWAVWLTIFLLAATWVSAEPTTPAATTPHFVIATEDESLAGVDRGDGRDAYGRFTGSGGYGAGAQAQGLDDYTTATGRDVISNQVRATLPDGTTRYYDGLSLGPDGTYQGVEVKSGSVGLTASQRAFDSQVDGGVPATAMVEGVPISITSTYLVRVP